MIHSATAHIHLTARRIQKFEKALDDFDEVLRGDLFIKSHLEALYDSLLQDNLCKIIEPYSRVEVLQLYLSTTCVEFWLHAGGAHCNFD